jgi:hypothetical protein
LYHGFSKDLIETLIKNVEKTLDDYSMDDSEIDSFRPKSAGNSSCQSHFKEEEEDIQNMMS